MYKNIYSTVIKREASLKKIVRECGGEYCVWVGGGGRFPSPSTCVIIAVIKALAKLFRQQSFYR